MQEIRSKRRRNPETWHKANRLIITLIVIGAIAIGLFAFMPELERRRALTVQLDQEQAKLSNEQLIRQQRNREVQLLQNDPEYVEIIARDKIGVMKEGETIFRVDTSPAKATPTAISAKSAKP